MPQRAKRRSLIIYTTLAVVFVAQLSWWVIHQIDLIDQRHSQYLRFADSRKEELLKAWKPFFAEIRDVLNSADSATPVETEDLRKLCISNPLIAGVTVTETGGKLVEVCGAMVGGIHVSAQRGDQLVALSVSYDDAEAAAQNGAPSLQFVAPSVDALINFPLNVNNFTYDSTEYTAYKQERESSLRMLLWEGGFFFVLTSLGLALIYRSLMRTRDAIKMQENFTMAVTHELRTPLSSLQLALDGLKRENLPEEKRQRLHTMIAIDLKRLGTLITNLLNVGRTIQRSSDEISDLNVTQVVQKYVADRADEFEIKRAHVSLIANSGSDTATYAKCNQADFERILDSLIDNAIKFSESNPQITIQVESSSRTVEIAVTDKGIGIPHAELEKVFDRFYRVGDELTRKRSGTGLGLYLARELAIANGGEMVISSDGRGKGTTVTLRLRMANA